MNKTNCSASDIIRRILEEILLHPEELLVTENRIGRAVVDLVVSPHPGDMSRVIGTAGKHSNAIFLLVSMIARRAGENIRCRIPDPPVQVREPNKPFAPKEKWNCANVTALAGDICDAIFSLPITHEIVDGENFISALDITTDPEESAEIVREARECLAPLFNAIGKTNGRHLFVTVAPDEEANARRALR